jgi:chromosome segregation ATPase
MQLLRHVHIEQLSTSTCGLLPFQRLRHISGRPNKGLDPEYAPGSLPFAPYQFVLTRVPNWQRIKDAIDSRIAEEQARQRVVIQSASPSRSGSTAGRPSQSRNISPSKRPRPWERTDLSTEKSPDPSDFDSDFAAGDESAKNVSRGDASEQLADGQTTELVGSIPKLPETSAMEGGEMSAPSQRSEELPTEVRVKVRKLERLEGKYRELLRAYRVAHARVQSIEPFEASLRENTPLTSINDPNALLEYLNQITLKSDMVLDELKRVTAERDDYRNKSDESQKETQALKDQVLELKQQGRDSIPLTSQSLSPRQSYDFPSAQGSNTATTSNSPPIAVKSPTPSTSSRIPSFSLFSPKGKAVKSPQDRKETTEEFFSYDNELPRLEAELQQRQTEIADLKKQVFSLQGDLHVARESTEGMVQSLEAATRELHLLRDSKENNESVKIELQIKIEELEQQLSSLRSHPTASEPADSCMASQIADMKVVLEEKENAMTSMSEAAVERDSQIAGLERDVTDLHEKVVQKDATVKDLEYSLAMAQTAGRQHSQQSQSNSASQKQIGVLNNIMESLRSQLNMAEHEIVELKEVKRIAEIEIEKLHKLKSFTNKEDEAFNKLTDGVNGTNVADFSEQPSTKYFGFVNNEEFSLSGEPLHAFRRFSEVLRIRRPELYEALVSPAKGREKLMESSEMQIVPSDTLKKSKKKKKKNKGGHLAVAEQMMHEPPAKVTETLNVAEVLVEALRPNLQQPTAVIQERENQIKELDSLLKEKDAAIDRLSRRLKDQDSLHEEIETLRDDLLHQGEEHVEAREALKTALLKKSVIQERLAINEKELADFKSVAAAGVAGSEETQKSLSTELEDTKRKYDALQRDLVAMEQLAASRFKDLTDLREVLSKVQPELRSLRSEVEELRNSKESLKVKLGDMARLESRHEDLKSDLKTLSRKLGEKDAEVKDLWQKVADERAAKTIAEEDLHTARSNLQSVEAARDAASRSHQHISEQLFKAKAEHDASSSKIREVEDLICNYVREVEILNEQINLKTSLHDSSQAMVASLREQTLELSIQAREASIRADSLNEELAETQKMLSERSREGETVRRLLADVEGRTSTKIHEMRERMETALEERDRVEDEVSTSNRRMAREVEDLRNKTREATRSWKVIEEEKEELERSHKDLKRKRDELEASEERARTEVAEVQAALQQIKEALDQREKESIELERQKVDMKRMFEDVQERAERLQAANKGLMDELKSLQQQRKGSVRPTPRLESEAQSSRSSLDSARPDPRNNSVAGSPVPNIRDKLPTSRSSTPTGRNASSIDYVYLKNVLLQFLEQKDKSHQKQLIPVLGMLLNFDR